MSDKLYDELQVITNKKEICRIKDFRMSYEELLILANEERNKAMSEETKKTVKEAQEFFKTVEEGAKTFQGVPDKKLAEKIKKVGDGAGEVIKHIEERTDYK